jgi:hypothetical protein
VIQIVLSDFRPNTNYLFTLVSPSHCLTPGGGFVTDEHGHATFHGVIGAVPAVGGCPAEGGDWSDSDIVFDVAGVTHAVAWNPN